MENKRFGLGVIVCVFNKDFSRILLLKRNKEKRNINKADWGNVGGRVEWGEKLDEACIREAKEEIGINLNIKRLKIIEIKETTQNPIAPEVHFLHFVYATTIDENEKLTLNFNCNGESDCYEWFDLNELPDKTLDSKEHLIQLSITAKKEFLEDEK